MDDELACARRTFEKACSADEPFACGTVGRMMLEAGLDLTDARWEADRAGAD